MRDEEELKHYGILGMKWGIRRYQPYPKGEGHRGIFKGKKSKSAPKNNFLEREKARSEKKAKASARATKRENAKTERQNARAIKREKNKKTKTVDDPKKVKKLSDEELKQVVQRLQMEKRYIELTTPKKSKGQKLVESFIADSAQKAAKAYVDEWIKTIGVGGNKQTSREKSSASSNKQNTRASYTDDKKKKQLALGGK